jgi:uncharacterized protein
LALAKKAAHAPQPAAEPVMVSARWLAGAIALTLVLAAICGYGALCLLFYQGQWQLLFHPTRAITATPASAGLAWEEVRFDVTDTGRPRLDGWWIPAAQGAPYARATVLYLHDARGSLSNCVPALGTLHALGINVFAFDYRGFGHSAGAHPTERQATDDAAAAWTYLTDLRHIPARELMVFGDGVGATLAAHLGAKFAPAGVILEDPNASARQIFLTDARARILPLVLVQKEKLDPTGDLAAGHAPRMFLDVRGDSARTRALFDASSYPKQYFDLRSSPDSALPATLRRFLDDVLH